MSSERKVRILWFAGHTLTTPSRSGVQRVVIDAAHGVSQVADMDIVKWDAVDGQLRYADAEEMAVLFGSNAPAPNRMCHRRQYRFGDTVSPSEDTWLIYPEIPFHQANGNRTLASIFSQCLEYNIKTAVVFYDLIPIRVGAYKDSRPQHEEYIREILRANVILSISQFSRNDLTDFIKQNCFRSENQPFEEVTNKIISLPLAGKQILQSEEDASEGTDKNTIVLVGTVEPRKQQTRFLRVFNDACARHPELKRLKIEVFGALHASSAADINVELQRNPSVTFHQYCDDELIQDAYSKALFSVFLSNYEGFGLPIVESLQHGVPCLTASFGSMAEVGLAGGCLLVDVNDDKAIEHAIIKMTTDSALRERLQGEIRQRKFRSWNDYARDLVAHLSAYNRLPCQSANEVSCRLERWLSDVSSDAHDMFSVGGVGLLFMNMQASEETFAVHADLDDLRSTIRVCRVLPGLPEAISLAALDMITASHVLVLPDKKILAAILTAANKFGSDAPLPQHIFVGVDQQHHETENCVKLLLAEKLKQLETKDSEEILSEAYTSWSGQQTRGEYALALIISTYNRADFVSMNVEWVLREIAKRSLPVVCVVVDNASTDDTRQKLARFSANPNFNYVCNPQNVGMLGNLRICSSLALAKHLWITGDDDFIAPGALARTLAIIKERPSMPFIFHNFAVYHRERVAPGDSAALYVSSGTTVGSECSESGIYPIYKIAGEHDNLFTAIYPIIFRSDIAAACFNHTFRGVPFSNLVESIPTTDIILGTYSFVEAQWFKEVGVVGNAHNSWSRHRPRWHLVLMPEALAKARNAGVDPKKIWKWLRVHRDLFEDSVEIAISKGTTAQIDPEDLETACRMFREEITLPSELQVASVTGPVA